MAESGVTRKINCIKCNAHLGEIRDAKLRTDIVYMCLKCATPKPRQPNVSIPDGFEKFFGGMFK